MKVIHFLGGYLPTFGGTTARMYNLFKYSNHEHHLYVKMPGERLPAISKFHNVMVHRELLEDSHKLGIPGLHSIKMVKENSNKLVESVDPKHYGNTNICHGHNPLEYALASLKFKKKTGIPLIYEVHGLVKDTIPINIRPWVPKAVYDHVETFYNRTEDRVLSNADMVIAQTYMMENRLINECSIIPDKIKVIHNGVDRSVFDPRLYNGSNTELRKINNWNGKLIFMYCGYLDIENGITFFLESLKSLEKEYSDRIKVVICGRGKLEDYVRGMGSQYPFIQFLGEIDYSLVPFYYSSIDCYVIPRPSTLPTESLVPIKLLESMAMQKIVLASKVKGITSIVKNGVNGLLYETDNKRDFLDKIRFIMDNYESLDYLGRNARNDMAFFDWKDSAGLLDHIYEDYGRGE